MPFTAIKAMTLLTANKYMQSCNKTHVVFLQAVHPLFRVRNIGVPACSYDMLL